MDFQVRLSDLFLSDLEEIVGWLMSHRGASVAAHVGHHLLQRAHETGRNPLMGVAVRQRPGARRVFWHSFVIYYDVHEERRLVEVLRVRHGHRNPVTLQLEP